jgi:hypothetical protein
MDHTEVMCEVADWTKVSSNREKTLYDPSISIKTGKYLTKLIDSEIFKKGMHCEVSITIYNHIDISVTLHLFHNNQYL